MKEAEFYEQMEDGRLHCELCAHECLVREDASGLCRVRKNIEGKLYSLNYGKLIAEHADPIEKKPLYHFLPGSRVYSIASPGCNFRCKWCQNWDISQLPADSPLDQLPDTSPEAVIAGALATGSRSIAYTYTEPVVFFEYAKAVGLQAKTNGMKNVFVSNGFLSTAALADLSKWLDAANIDIKAFDDQVYRKYMGGRLAPVLEACETLKKAGVWLEITTLLVPGLNDSNEQLEGLAQFIAEKLGRETPWHLSRYYPNYQFNAEPPTSMRTIQNAVSIGRRAGLKFMYIGNAGLDLPTRCPSCGEVLIERDGYQITQNKLVKGTCPSCQTAVPGVWS